MQVTGAGRPCLRSSFAKGSGRLSGGSKANKRAVIKRRIQIAPGCNETGYVGVGQTTVEVEPSSRELHPIGAGAGISTTPTGDLKEIVKTQRPLINLQTQVGQSPPGDPKVTRI